MIRLVEWLIGKGPETRDRERDRVTAETLDLDRHAAESQQQRAEAKQYRRTAERIGPALRAELQHNHFGERIRYALHQEGWGR